MVVVGGEVWVDEGVIFGGEVEGLVVDEYDGEFVCGGVVLFVVVVEVDDEGVVEYGVVGVGFGGCG